MIDKLADNLRGSGFIIDHEMTEDGVFSRVVRTINRETIESFKSDSIEDNIVGLFCKLASNRNFNQ